MVRRKGKFWPTVRAMIWEKAQELFQYENATGLKDDFKGITATHAELREGGYFDSAKIIVLREIYLSRKPNMSVNNKEGECVVQETHLP